MEYIIFDLEWNQPNHTDLTYLSETNMELTGEIIQIGAVKVNENIEVIDTFDIIIKPKFLKSIQEHIISLTGISEERIRNGESFEKAIKKFIDWCGINPKILSWGSDDLLLLKENLRVYQMQDAWKYQWYDAQKIYAWKQNQDLKQVALKKALENFEIPLNIPQHYALNDALYTAKILHKIKANSVLEIGKIGAEAESNLLVLPAPLKFSIHGAFSEKRQIFRTKSVVATECPYCKSILKRTSIEKIQSGRYISLAECRKHGQFSIFWKVHKVSEKWQDNKMYITRSVNNSNKKIKAWYYEKVEKNRKKRERYLARKTLGKMQIKDRK